METVIPRFVADVHLGKLARLLRMLGFDTLYSNQFSNTEMVSIAQEEQRVLLSRNTAIGRQQSQVVTFLINNDNPVVQLEAVLQHFHLLQHIQPFSRCMVCNGLPEPVSKESILAKLPEQTAVYYHEFWQCTTCHRIYWKGPHYNRMMHLIKQISDSRRH